MYKEPKVYVCDHLKSLEEYSEELKEIHRELQVGIGTGTLIESDLKLLQRADEIVVIQNFIRQQYALHHASQIKRGVEEDGTKSEKE